MGGYLVKESACFPTKALVQLQDGSTIEIKDLKKGDMVMSSPTTYSKVYMFTHSELDSKNIFIKITTKSGHCIKLTPSHFLYVNKTLLQAMYVKIGDMLETTSNTSDQVISVSSETDIGIFNPVTYDGTIMVDGGIHFQLCFYKSNVNSWYYVSN